MDQSLCFALNQQRWPTNFSASRFIQKIAQEYFLFIAFYVLSSWFFARLLWRKLILDHISQFITQLSEIQMPDAHSGRSPTGVFGLPMLRMKYSLCPPIATRWNKALKAISTIKPIELKIDTFVQLATGTRMVAGKAKEGQVWTHRKAWLEKQGKGLTG